MSGTAGERNWVAEDEAAGEAWEREVVRDAMDDIIEKQRLFLLLTRGEGPVECDGETFDDVGDFRLWVECCCRSVHVRTNWKPANEVRSFLGLGRKKLELPGQYRIRLGEFSGPWVQITGPLAWSGEPIAGPNGTLRLEYKDSHTRRRFPVTPREEAALHWLATMVVVI